MVVTRHTGAPRQGLHETAPGSSGPGFSARPRTSRLQFRPSPTWHRTPFGSGRSSFVTYVDRQLSCVDCGVEFIHSAADQEFYAQRGFVSEPKRCTSCRASRRQARESGYDVSRHRRPARLRAKHRPPGTRVLRGRVLVVRQPGPGPVQAAHGSSGLLLGLLPAGEAGLTPRTPAATPVSAPDPQSRGADDSLASRAGAAAPASDR